MNLYKSVESQKSTQALDHFTKPSGIVLDLRVGEGQAFVLDQGSGSLLKIDLETGLQSFIGGINVFEFPVDIVLNTDSGKNLFYVTDAGALNPPALFEIDLATGVRRTISGGSGSEGGTVLPFMNPSGIALDLANDLVYVTDLGRKALLSVNILTGVRTIVSDENNGDGETLAHFQRPSNIALDSANDHAYVTDEGLGSLIEVNLLSRDRTIVSGGPDRIGSGPDLLKPLGIALDLRNPANVRAYVLDNTLKALVHVDLSAEPSRGDRTIISDGASGTATHFFNNLSGIALSADGRQAFLTDKGLKALFAVNLLNGDRTILSDINHGVGDDGTELDNPSGLAVDHLTNKALVIDDGLDSKKLISVDLITGDRKVVSDPLTLNKPRGIALNSIGKAFVIDDSEGDSDTLFKVDLSSGTQESVISSGLPFSSPRGIALTNHFAFVVDSDQRALLSVNLSNGNRLTVSDGTRGPVLSNPLGVALDTADRAYIIDEGLQMLLSVDLKSGSPTKGDRTIISENPDPNIETRGIGTPFISPAGLALDLANNRAFIIDPGLNALSLVELESGDRVVISR